ncbi:MAG TPA: SDR family NAD(P)-dependent oxidoreductase [Methanospirillum sp.]|jgi:short-subunit dehydrogenase|nr:SDR family NAD(P)-dependent oxidoreductase [Methanospirillum sp.]
MSELTGKTILLTGATGGFGQKFVRQLLDEGAQLILTDLDETLLDKIASEMKNVSHGSSGSILAIIPSDLSTQEGCKELYAKCKDICSGIDVLINNAGILTYGFFHETPVDKWYKVMEINLFAPMHLSALFLPDMIARKNGHLVFMCSVSGFLATSFETTYTVSKFGLRGFSMALAGEVAEHGISTTTIYPFWADTSILKSSSYGTRKGKRPNQLLIIKPEKIVRTAIEGIKKKRRHVYADPYTRLFWWLIKFWPIVGKQPVE